MSNGVRTHPGHTCHQQPRRTHVRPAHVSATELLPPHDIALFDGGPFARSLRLARLRRDELRELCWRRALFLAAFAWLPLLLLSSWQGLALGAGTRMPFLLDASAHVRFLVALPLLVFAEITVHERAHAALESFVTRQMVAQQELPRFEAAVAGALRMRDSWLAEALMLALVLSLAVGQVGDLAAGDTALAAASWQALPAADGGGRSLAGAWFVFASLPLFQFVTLRWYYRILVWTILLWRVSRLHLQLVPTHPDRVAGLGFLDRAVYAYVPLALAHGCMLSSVLVNRIIHGGARLTDFQADIVMMVAFVFLLAVGPLLAFAPALLAAERKGTAEYAALATVVTRTFDTRWLRGATRAPGEMLDVSEVSAMCDLDATLGIVRQMRYVPITRESMIWIAVAVLAPVAPLLLTVMPAEELLKKLLGMIL
jgi:hypothetical protein